GTGGFAGNAEQVGSGWGVFDVIVAPGDWDGDGHSDLVARKAADNTLWLYQGNGVGGFKSGAGTQIGSAWGQFDAVIAAGDWDGDGHSDLVARKAADGTLWLYEGNGVGGFEGGAGT